MIRVCVAGATGWVGRALVPAVAAASDLAMVAAVARKAAGQDAGEAVGAAKLGVALVATIDEALTTPFDVLVDYTAPDAVRGNTLAAVAAKRHVVIGTSGLTADDYVAIDKAARGSNVGVLAAGNFSITATLLKRFAQEAARYVADVEIIDYASESKPDTPSGTARELAEVLSGLRGVPTALPIEKTSGVLATRGAEIGSGPHGGVRVHSLRLPSYVISVEALFGADNERLTIRHDAGSSAAPYVAGTLLAVRRVGEKTGLRRGLDSLIG
jgi:4-hydroxy-tetrahydrodipicolinate reductase